ncbi:DUF2459 domain-containing protein [Rhodohalobacter sp. 8-1]|uniref:DUF2459 domain-containing protein n=1 Tax=Rhodohalobacter sp. 8-1 TaxID=3131972 RepID=UPI0030EE1363
MKKLPIILILILSGCAGPVPSLYPDDENKRPIPVYIISHGWHVGIAIESEYIKPQLPNHDRLPNTSHLMFGWGDKRYYTDSEAGFWLMIRAAFIPTASVLHVVGIDRPVDRYFPSSTVIRVMVTEPGAEKLAEYISNQFQRVDGEAQVFADGLYPNSIFFEATGRYYFPNTSNKWTARAIRKTGFPITPFYAVTSGNVIRQAKKHGQVIQQR